MDFKMYFMLFIIYSIIGWIVEVVGLIIQEKRFINRGFLIGPYCPIYGVGGLIIILLLKKYMDDPVALFIMAVVVCSLVEYFTSYIMEKLFKTRWWDYSNYKFNINGRICLETMWLFGVLAIFVMYVVNPPLISILETIPSMIFNLIFIIILVIFLIDISISLRIILNVKSTVKLTKKDSTEEITKYVREVLSSKSKLNRRLVNAFPNLQAKIKNFKEEIRKEIDSKVKKNK